MEKNLKIDLFTSLVICDVSITWCKWTRLYEIDELVKYFRLTLVTSAHQIGGG